MRRQNKTWRLNVDQAINLKASMQKRLGGCSVPFMAAMVAAFCDDPMELSRACYRLTGTTLREVAEGGGRR